MTTATSASTKDRLLDAARDLFYRDGFHSVGLDRILADVGVTKTTFYNHFQSKDDLVLEVLRRHDRWWRDTFLQMLRDRGGDSPRGQLESIFDAVRDMLLSDDYHGCIFINVAVQFPQAHDPAHIAAAEHKLAMESLLRELAGYAGAKNPKTFAEEFSMLMEGAYVTQQVTRREETLDIANRLGRMLIEQHLPARS